jgi:putative DNA primase/helicase
MTWVAFVEWQRSPRRTSETAAEYAAMTKAERDKAKAGAAYVAGYLTGGKRSKATIKRRSMLTLDADTATAELWEDYCLLVGATALLYSTHSYTEAKPKYRLVLPLSRDVTPDEYQALSMKVAECVGLAYFDATGYQPERLMYKSSCSADAPFVFEVLDSEPLDVDRYLALYPDWRDTSCWPVTGGLPRNAGVPEVQDPTEKPGVIGAFCRLYDVPAAIETFLPDTYTEAGEGRYTYADGSAWGGLVVYEDGKWAYSNHATDPAATGRLCNAFDLVRLHKWGELDAEAREGTPVNKLPSVAAAMDFALALEDVKAELDREAIKGAVADFDDDADTDDGDTEQKPKPRQWLIHSKGKAPQIDYVALAKELAGELELFYNASEFLRYDPEMGVWLGGCEPYVRQYIQQRKLGSLSNNLRRSEALHALQSELYTPRRFDTDDPSVIVLANGIYDVPTGVFREGFDSRIHVRTRHDIHYDPDADCPAFTELVGAIYGDETLPFIFEWFGYCLYRAYPIKALLMLYGKRDTGKSALINLLQAFVGSGGYSNITLKALCNKSDRFSTINLLGKTLNADADAKAEFIGDGAELKMLVGGDTVSAEAKGQPFVQFKNYAKLVFGLNRMPKASVAEAIASKIKILETGPAQYTADEFSDLLEEAAGERAGVFNKAMVGLRRALRRRRFSETERMKDASTKWHLENDNVAMFINECVCTKFDEVIKTSEMYQVYKNWCFVCGHAPQGKHMFNRSFAEKGYRKAKPKSEVWCDVALQEDGDGYAL